MLSTSATRPMIRVVLRHRHPVLGWRIGEVLVRGRVVRTRGSAELDRRILQDVPDAPREVRTADDRRGDRLAQGMNLRLRGRAPAPRVVDDVTVVRLGEPTGRTMPPIGLVAPGDPTLGSAHLRLDIEVAKGDDAVLRGGAVLGCPLEVALLLDHEASGVEAIAPSLSGLPLVRVLVHLTSGVTIPGALVREVRARPGWVGRRGSLRRRDIVTLFRAESAASRHGRPRCRSLRGQSHGACARRAFDDGNTRDPDRGRAASAELGSRASHRGLPGGPRRRRRHAVRRCVDGWQRRVVGGRRRHVTDLREDDPGPLAVMDGRSAV